MNTKILATLGAAALAIGASVTASKAAVLAQPGETMGVALGAPLPEGVFFVDLESYGKGDGQPNRLGVNIPLIVWSTPFSFYDTRIEVAYAAPFLHQDGATVNRVDAYSQLFGFILAHDFGNGFNAGVALTARPQDNFANAGRGVGADIRPSISYVKDGFDFTLTGYYEGNFGGVYNPAATYSDSVFLDYTATKKFDKLELGVVGYAYTDIGNVPVAIGRHGAVAVGGLVGYDFGKFTLQAMVTREVASRPSGGFTGSKDTRGWVRLILPLYVAPAAPLVRARY